ncbi:MAG TPA: TetR family transcriptional regulator [Vicinamibacterales bacterium]|nr:TetR family transcriptional regulator [Vicinamibacterales bacterium]
MARRPRIDWIDFALAALATDGPAALVPDALAARAGLTRGAFYHRFASVDAFQAELLECWRQRNTQTVIDLAAAADGLNARQRALAAASASIDHALDRAVRAWALHDARARAAVAAVDATRIGFIRDCLPPRTSQRARLAEALYLLFVGAQQVRPDLNGAALKRLLDPLDAALMQGFASAAPREKPSLRKKKAGAPRG